MLLTGIVSFLFRRRRRMMEDDMEEGRNNDGNEFDRVVAKPLFGIVSEPMEDMLLLVLLLLLLLFVGVITALAEVDAAVTGDLQ
jgi:hypothetical protein